MQKTERKEKEQEYDAKTRYACRLCEARHERLVFERIACKEEQDAREDGDRCGDGEKFGKRQMVMVIDEKILRISDGRQHTAQIRRDGHPCEDRNHKAKGMGLFEERDRKRHEDDQGNVIREYHGGKEGEKNEYPPHLPALHGLLKEIAEKAAEESCMSKSRYDGHERKKEREELEIDTLSKRRRTDLGKARRHECKKRCCSKIGVSFDKAHGRLLSDGNGRLHEK